MKPLTLKAHHNLAVSGRCVVELKTGARVEADRPIDVPDAVRNAGANWPEDVKVNRE
jgi:hypothetical protein